MSITQLMILAAGILLSLASTAVFAQAAEPTTQPTTQPGEKVVDPSFVEVADDPKLPRVLLIGDSISMEYTLRVRELLKGKANVHRPAENCADTARGLIQIDKWLGDSKGDSTGNDKWDVIHFNFGLHDVKYLDAEGNYTSSEKGKQVAPPDVYEKNLRELVARLKKTGAKLIWASTTPIPAGTKGRVGGDDIPYNELAAKVMADNHIPIDDLHAVVTDSPKPLQLPKNVHFSKEGYRELANAVAESIEKALATDGQ